MSEEKQDIVVGSGRLYFQPKGQDGEVYFGDTPGFQIGLQTDKLDVYSSDSPVAEKIESVVRNVVRTASITCQNVSQENLAMWLLGDETALSQTAVEVTDEEATVKKGEWYQLGGGVGVKEVSSVTVQGSPDKANTYKALTEDEDYKLDAKLGRILMLKDVLAHDEPIKITYTPKAEKYPQVQSSDDKTIEGALRFISDNTTGTNRDLWAPHVTIEPEGQIELKSRDNPVQMTFNIEFIKEVGEEALYITNREAG